MKIKEEFCWPLSSKVPFCDYLSRLVWSKDLWCKVSIKIFQFPICILHFGSSFPKYLSSLLYMSSSNFILVWQFCSILILLTHFAWCGVSVWKVLYTILKSIVFLTQFNLLQCYVWLFIVTSFLFWLLKHILQSRVVPVVCSFRIGDVCITSNLHDVNSFLVCNFY